MDVLDDVIVVPNDIYNPDLLLDENEENEKNEISLEIRITISESNIIINLLITDIQTLLSFSLSFILLIKTDIELMYNPGNNKKLLFFHLVFGF